MGVIRLYVVGQNIGTQFILRDYPELNVFSSYAQRKNIKRLNMEQYFRGVSRNLMEYTKVVYGPVFGQKDPRNGFIFEHNESGELIAVDENDIPITYEKSDVLIGDLLGIYKTDSIENNRKVITSYTDMINQGNHVSNSTLYNQLIRDEWIPDKSFLVIE